jgi:undecaprenyl-diphosphatase
MQKTSVRPIPFWLTIGKPAVVVFTVALCIIFTLAGYGRAVALGIVQGLGEFLPISSSAHLIIVPWLFGWSDGTVNTVTFDVALHMGTLLALLGFFWRDWVELLLAAPKPRSGRGRLFWLIVLASIPGGIAGLLLEGLAEGQLRSPPLIACTLALMGVLLWAADRWAPQQRSAKRMGTRDALLIGCAQALALIPGVSRSGGTMTVGRALGFKRQTAARFSFLMSVPITAAVGLLKLRDIAQIPASEMGTVLVGTLIAALVGALSISFLLSYLRRASFAAFAIYRMALAALILAVWLIRA